MEIKLPFIIPDEVPEGCILKRGQGTTTTESGGKFLPYHNIRVGVKSDGIQLERCHSKKCTVNDICPKFFRSL
jgi:hypothetical protein